MKEFIFAGIFCSKCFNIISDNQSGNLRICQNCIKSFKEKEMPKGKKVFH